MDIFTIQEEAYKRGYEAGVKFAKDTNVPSKWIPVTERLPTEEDADSQGCVLAVEKSDKLARRWEIGGIRKYPETFTHWMSVPELPKGE